MWTKYYFDMRKAWVENQNSSNVGVFQTSYPCKYQDDTTGYIGVSTSSYVDTKQYFSVISWSFDTTYVAKAMEKSSKGATGSMPFYFTIGSGTTPPTINDYKLENQVTTLTPTLFSTKTFENEKFKFENIVLLSNNTEEDVTIGEAGIFFLGGYHEYRKCYPILVNRITFDPVVIPAGGVGKITWTYTEPIIVSGN